MENRQIHFKIYCRWTEVMYNHNQITSLLKIVKQRLIYIIFKFSIFFFLVSESILFLNNIKSDQIVFKFFKLKNQILRVFSCFFFLFSELRFCIENYWLNDPPRLFNKCSSVVSFFQNFNLAGVIFVGNILYFFNFKINFDNNLSIFF